ncbi:MAG: T9SS type A sorting domain-containing protein [Bacteroidota bacterium]
MKKQTTLCLFLLLIPGIFSKAQELIAPAGGAIKNDSHSIEWSIGESAIETLSDGEYTITQGFHQSTIVITSIKGEIPDEIVKVYPNPTSDEVNIAVEGKYVIEQVKLFDTQGKLLFQESNPDNFNIIDFRHYIPATYILVIEIENHQSNEYRIIKK